MYKSLLTGLALVALITYVPELQAEEGPDAPRLQTGSGSTEGGPAWKLPMERGGPVFRIRPELDIPVILIGGLTIVGWTLGDELPGPSCGPVCDKDDVNGFDRWSAGYYDERWATATDITLGSTIGVGVVSLLASAGFGAGLLDMVIALESVVTANASIVLLNLAARRPRPYMYSAKAPDDVRESGKASLSFPSGHVGCVFATTSSIFSLLHARNPSSPWPWVFLGFGTAAGGAVAVGRVKAGRHFASDVIIGAALGTAVGFLVPALHEKNVTVMPTVGEGSGGLAVQGRF